MARILVAGADGSLAQRTQLDNLVQRLRQDGHDAARFNTQPEAPATAVRECDAVIAILDSLDAGGAATIAFARAADKPCLGLASTDVAPILAELTQVIHGDTADAWWQALPAFYDEVRPFAGRVVRDRIPELVKEAGHDVKFRRLDDEEKPRFLKQKVANEAKELLSADLGDEKEEVADVLEAMEAFIRSRGFDRDELRRVKDAKRKRRGGFERCFVVETTSQGDAPATTPEAPERPEEPTHAEPAPAAPSEPVDRHGVATADTIDFAFDDEPVEDEPDTDDLLDGRDVKAEFREL